jgi:hypothetical protein
MVRKVKSLDRKLYGYRLTKQDISFLDLVREKKQSISRNEALRIALKLAAGVVENESN